MAGYDHPCSVRGPDGREWCIRIASGGDDGDVFASHLAWGRALYVVRRLPYLVGRRRDVRLVVTRADDRAQRRLLDQRFSTAADASAAAEQLETEIKNGGWPVS